MHFFSHAVSAVLRFDNWFVKKEREIIDMPIRAQNYVPAPSAITAIWSTFRNKFLSPKTHATTAAIARLRKNFDSINEHVSEELKRAIVKL